MNNLEVILESIISEGNKESQTIIDEAKAKRDEIVNEAKTRAESEASDIIAKAKTEASTIVENEAISSNRQSRDIEITAKNELIDDIVGDLLENLKNLDNKTYKKFVTNTLAKSKITSGELLLSKNHKDAITDNEIAGLKVSDDTVEDGFVVRSGKIEYDNRFSSILKYNIDDIRKQISSEIFKWGGLWIEKII